MKKPKGVAVMRIIIKPKKGGSDDSPVDDDADDDYDGVQEDDDGHSHGMGMAMKLIQSLMGGGDEVDKAEDPPVPAHLRGIKGMIDDKLPGMAGFLASGKKPIAAFKGCPYWPYGCPDYMNCQSCKGKWKDAPSPDTPVGGGDEEDA